MANADVHVKVDSVIKAESEAILKKIGISLSDLINMTLRRVVYERRIPFNTKVSEVEIPKNMSIETLEELEEYIEKSMEKDNGARYTIDEVRGHMKEKRDAYEKIYG